MAQLLPEAQAREQIDALLSAAGWTLQDYDRYNPSASRAIALREIPMKGGRCDYLLLLDRQSVGVIEAKKTGPRSRWWPSSRRGTARTCRSFCRHKTRFCP